VAIACIASFMVVMDGAIVNVALPAMQEDLHLSAVAVQWVIDAYFLVLGGFMLLAARASDVFGRKVVLQTGLAVFTLASLGGGMATSSAGLLLARAVQGLGASALATSTLAVIVAVYPAGTLRARAISWWAATSSIGSAMGVVLGGWLTSQAGWRWVMYVNVPVGVALMACVALSLAPASKRTSKLSLDVPGALAVTLGMGALLLGISQAAHWGWASPMVLGSLALAAVLIGLFVVVENRTTQPLVRMDIFKVRNVRVGNVMVVCVGIALTGSTFLSSLVLQRVVGYNALDAGLALLPFGLTFAVAAILSRKLMDHGVRHLPLYGGLISAVGLAWMASLPMVPTFVLDLLVPMVLMGMGLGLMVMTVTHTAVDGVPPKDAGLASGLLNTARQLGAALGVAILSTVVHSVASASSLQDVLQAHMQGYHVAFLATAGFVMIAGLLSLLLDRALPAK
jgi:EmrB/QacA subfamily drug resistance transporter